MTGEAPTHTAVRTCVGCGGRDQQRRLVRVQMRSGRLEVVDVTRNGRSAYVHLRSDCVERVRRGRLLRRSLRLDSDGGQRAALVEELESRLRTHV
jgi:predicted RNA-binding protein YlxR (DUF448 family)